MCKGYEVRKIIEGRKSGRGRSVGVRKAHRRGRGHTSEGLMAAIRSLVFILEAMGVGEKIRVL